MRTETRRMMLASVFFCGVLIFLLTAVDARSDQGGTLDPNVIGQIITKFDSKAQAWGSVLQGYAFSLFKLCLTLSIVIFGAKVALNRTPIQEVIGQFIIMLLFAGFIAAVISHYQEWAWNLINGLKKISVELGAPDTAAASPLEVAWGMIKSILKKISVWSPGDAIGYVVCALVMVITFALITAQVVFIKCEAIISMNASIILLGFGGSEFTKDYAINVMRYVLAVAFKLFVLQLLLGVGMQFISELQLVNAEFQEIFVAIACSLILLALVKSIPDVCSGIINGSHVSSGSALGQAATSVAAVGGAVALGALGGGGGAMNAASAVNKASQVANASGATGLGKIGKMAGSLWNAHKEAKTEGGKLSHGARMNNSLGTTLQDMKMRKMSEDSGDGSRDGSA